MVTLYCAETGMPAIESDSRRGQVAPRETPPVCLRVRRVIRGIVGGRALIVAVLATMLWAAVSASAATVPGSARKDPLPSPQAMVLRGTNGYRVTVNAYRSGRRGSASVVVSAGRLHSLIGYTAPANLAAEGIHASLGRFGRIDLRWVPDGRIAQVRFGCHGHGPRRQLFFSRGAYVGALAIRGGNGFTAVRAHRVEWKPSWYRGASTCRREGGELVPGRGEILYAGAGGHHPSANLTVYQSKPGARVFVAASDKERVGRIAIERSTVARGSPRTFAFSSDFAIASVSPPQPFSGTARFARTEGDKGTWLGDLSVRFPDGRVAPLAGRSFEASFYSGELEGLAVP
jgi:hypothetical protein